MLPRMDRVILASRKLDQRAQIKFLKVNDMRVDYDPIEDMPDFREWMAANGSSFDFPDYIHAQVMRGALTADALMSVILLVWPSFVEVDGFVALQSRRDRVRELVSQGVTGKEVEYWCNHLNIDGLLPGIEVSLNECVGAILRNAWAAKLASQFPLLKFNVILLSDSDSSEVSVTFHQVE